jgi:hypothetical protein
VNTISYKKTFLLFAFALLPQSLFCLPKSIKSQEPAHMQLLSEWKKTIKAAHKAKVEKLLNSKNLKKQHRGAFLKERIHLDHIKVMLDGKTIYLQLENSFIFLGRHHYPYNQQRLEETMKMLYESGAQLDEKSIKIYASSKDRENFILKYLWPHRDLYSAQITVEDTKLHNKNN